MLYRLNNYLFKDEFMLFIILRKYTFLSVVDIKKYSSGKLEIGETIIGKYLKRFFFK